MRISGHPICYPNKTKLINKNEMLCPTHAQNSIIHEGWCKKTKTL